MGTYRQAVVDLDASVEDAVEHGRRGRDWLEAEGYIRPVPWEGAVVYLAGPRWREAVDLAPWDWRASIKALEREPGEALEVITGRTVFYAGQGDPPAAICPHCRNATPTSAWPSDTFDAIAAWYASGVADLDCPACAHRTPLPGWDWTDDYFAFACLGFQFDDWPPLHPRFTTAFGQALGHRIRVVTGKI
ncbi:hypothetical protein [Streptomyces melanogenes]|uniref:hypothetical protein n=1 Tax=Streptomyces melanogenes TaxID=67326 RepID=UPI00379082D5